MEERLSSRSVAELCFAATRGIFESDRLASSSFLAAIRRALALLRKQYSRLRPPNREIMQQPNTIAAMLPLRFHSRYCQHAGNFGPHGFGDSPSSSAVELLVAVAVEVLVFVEALVVVVEELVVVELVVELVDVEVVEVEVVDVEAVDVEVVDVEEVEVEVSDVEVAVVDVVEVDVSDVVVSVVSVVVSVDVAESVVAVVSLAWMISSYPRLP